MTGGRGATRDERCEMRLRQRGASVVNGGNPAPSGAANLTGACPSHLRLEVEEWMLCASSYGCIWVDGTKMTGLVLPGAYETSWIKLSD